MIDKTKMGFIGELSDVEILPGGDASLPLSGPDLQDMARLALQYLEHNPDPEHGHQCRFSIPLLYCPPFSAAMPPVRDLIDPIMIGDTENRNDIAFNLMHDMTCSRDGDEARAIVHDRLLSYMRGDDGLCWVVPFCMGGSGEEEYAMVWTTSKLLQSESDLYRLGRGEEHKATARKLFEGLRGIARWQEGRAYFPGGISPFNGDKIHGGYKGHYPNVVGPLLEYWQSCGDGEALDFARAMAEGFMADIQPHHLHRADGSLEGHNHVQLHAVKGVAQLAALTRDPRMLEWVKKIYDYFREYAFDTGWLPEIRDNMDHNTHSETCLTADMTEIEIWLARAGMTELWDRADRTFRNNIVPAQFRLTPEFDALWREVNSGKSAAEIESGLEMLRGWQGGFISALSPNALIFELRPGRNHFGMVEKDGRTIAMDMMGCCPPEGIKTIYLIERNTVVSVPETGVLVNLAYDCDAPEAAVRTTMPGKGSVTVTAKVASDFLLRVPTWTDRGMVAATRGGKPVDAPEWGGPALGYIVFREVKPGETISISWPLVKFTQTVTEKKAAGAPGRTFTYTWVGSTAVDVSPAGEWMPLYRGFGSKAKSEEEKQ